jgi:hypothetical protein
VIYSDDGETLYHKIIQSSPGADAHLRRATLEDVFLRLTGRGLRE